MTFFNIELRTLNLERFSLRSELITELFACSFELF
jgi:hypothetical protein